MRTRKPARWLRIVVAALVIALGSGAGLPGIVHALAPAATHVCTCASGGGHDSCPVCSPSLQRARSHHCALTGVPCGEERNTLGLLGGAGEPGVVPGACALLIVECVRMNVARDVIPSPGAACVEPPTPPPRLVLA